MSAVKVALVCLSLYVAVNSKPHIKGASCDVDTSLPCECTNPFGPDSEHFFLGNADVNCRRAKVCYVKNQSGCSDTTQSRGGGRCQSKEACLNRPSPTKPPTTPATTNTPTPTTVSKVTTITTSPTVEGGGEGEGVSVAVTVSPSTPASVASTVSPSTPAPTTPSSPAPTPLEPVSLKFCECLIPSESRDACIPNCEVDCLADCNDLVKEEDGKCSSELATQEDLLFECPKPTCPPGGDKICLCASKCADEDAECEVNCESDCNDIKRKEGKCYSELACLPGLLFECVQ